MNCENRKARADASEERICPGLSLRGKGEREIAEEKEGWMKKAAFVLISILRQRAG